MWSRYMGQLTAGPGNNLNNIKVIKRAAGNKEH